jgi:hypothetical protein
MDLSNTPIEKLVELKNTIEGMIRSYNDGYLYICKVHSFGRNWQEQVKNVYELEELCMRYNGDNGIVDVYTTNPNVSFHNYGDLMYIESQEDYDSWRMYEDLKSMVPRIKKELDEWDNRDNVPFMKRPKFTPVYTRESLAKYERMLDEYDMSFVPPKPIHDGDEE